LQEEEFEGLGSHCVQHEIDHLDGILFVDYLSRIRKNMIIKRIAKIKKNMNIL
jgi:peptide deformylase